MNSTLLQLSLPARAEKNYPILVASGLIKKIDQQLGKMLKVSRYVIITDSTIRRLFVDQVLYSLRKGSLAKMGAKFELISFPAGEKFKNEATKMKLDHALLARKCGRDTMILAIGGGVVGDMAGFVAATYMRGIPYVHIPTTLLAMVDSSIGGKVGIDTPYGKNLLGAFWHPQAVIADMDFLKKLPQVQLINGLLEAIKIFLTHDRESFEFVRKNLPKILKKDPKVLQKVIARAIELKISVVTRDEREGNERMVLNFGHTIGHALEYLSGYRLLHGFAVGLGILVESKISQLLGILSTEDYATIEEILLKLGVDAKIIHKFSVRDILRATQSDKKSSNGRAKYVLLKKIGQVQVTGGKFGHVVDPKIVKNALLSFITF